jgi:hypothetical protein
VVEGAHDSDAIDLHVRVLRDGDLDAAHDRDGVDRHGVLGEPGIAEVDLAAAQDRDGGELRRHDPVALADEPAEDRDGGGPRGLAAEPIPHPKRTRAGRQPSPFPRSRGRQVRDDRG